VAVALLADGLDAPIGITGDPSGRLLVNEQVGRVTAIETDGSTSLVLDITDRVGSGGERGLLGLALHPGWPQVARAFVHYTDAAGDTVLAEFSSADGRTLDAASEQILLQVDQPYANHNGGQLSFGPDGRLYLALGDGGSGGDPQGHGQDVATLLGSILRLDVDAAPGSYVVPPDNPFAGGGGAPEIWAYGLRNPWRFSFDRAGGDLWIGDVGQGGWEEVDRLRAGQPGGANLGWNLMEGTHCFAVEPCDAAGLVPPVAEYPTGSGCAVTGGFVYRGGAMAGLTGWYLLADYCSGLVSAVRSDTPDGSVASPVPLLETGLTVSAFGEDAAGELYLADHGGGAIYRIVAGG
jgi:glucose/arabinose dehydrogenase